MKLHERYFIVEKAHNEIDKFVIDAISKHELTYGELFNILGRIVTSWSKWAIKDERKDDAKEPDL